MPSSRRREVWYSTRQHSNTESFAKKSYVYRTEPRLLHDFCRRDEGIPPYRLSTDSGIELIIVYIRDKKREASHAGDASFSFYAPAQCNRQNLSMHFRAIFSRYSPIKCSFPIDTLHSLCYNTTIHINTEWKTSTYQSRKVREYNALQA